MYSTIYVIHNWNKCCPQHTSTIYITTYIVDIYCGYIYILWVYIVGDKGWNRECRPQHMCVVDNMIILWTTCHPQHVSTTHGRCPQYVQTLYVVGTCCGSPRMCCGLHIVDDKLWTPKFKLWITSERVVDYMLWTTCCGYWNTCCG